MFKIKSLELKNFKAYQNKKFNFSNLTVFCGNNSVGKSTAIQALGMILQSKLSKSLQINGDLVHIDDIHNFQNRTQESLSIAIDTDKFSATWGYEDGEQREGLLGKNALLFIDTNENLSDLIDYLSIEKELKFQYLQAERFGPRDNLSLSQHSYYDDWLGTKGEFTIEVLERLINKNIVQLSNRVESGNDVRKHASITSHDIARNIEAWMAEISPEHKINPKKEVKANAAFNSIIPEHGYETKPINIGFGYSYALGIVSALLLAKADNIIIIENPEAHLHPRGQSYLGRLITLTAMSGVQVVIETHSDHLLNGMRVIARTEESYKPSIFTLYYVSKGESQSDAEKIELGNDGKLSSWPEGFFDQQVQDMFTIMTGQTELPNKGN